MAAVLGTAPSSEVVAPDAASQELSLEPTPIPEPAELPGPEPVADEVVVAAEVEAPSEPPAEVPGAAGCPRGRRRERQWACCAVRRRYRSDRARVAELMAETVVREVAWEVVPDLAEVVIKERIRELETEAESE